MDYEVVEEMQEISIHAPREGSDATSLLITYTSTNFNPRSP